MPPLVLALLLAAVEPSESHTAHYDIRSAALDAREAGELLEGLHAQLLKFVGREPDGRLVVEIYADREAFQRALAADGQPRTDGGGYYSPATKKVYLYPQPSEYFTRQLLLHEATHQFHLLAVCDNCRPRAGWYREGLAEYFAMHRWDGKRLETGVVPAITLEDYPAEALKQFDAAGRRLEPILTGRVKAGRPLAWALVHFLVNRDPRRFATMATALDRDDPPLVAWQQAYGRIRPEVAAEFRRWIERHSQPWEIVWTAWQQWGEAIEGRSDVMGLSVLKHTPDRLEAELEPVDGRLKAGLVFGFRSKEDFYLLEVAQTSQTVSIGRRLDGVWKILTSRTISLAGSRPVVRLVRDGERVDLSVEGQPVASVKAPGRVGLAVDRCKVRFHVK